MVERLFWSVFFTICLWGMAHMSDSSQRNRMSSQAMTVSVINNQ